MPYFILIAINSHLTELVANMCHCRLVAGN